PDNFFRSSATRSAFACSEGGEVCFAGTAWACDGCSETTGLAEALKDETMGGDNEATRATRIPHVSTRSEVPATSRPTRLIGRSVETRKNEIIAEPSRQIDRATDDPRLKIPERHANARKKL